MLRNYLKTAWRNLTRNPGYTFINIGGLAAGMAVAMLNGLWIWDELSFNRYFQKYDRIAQVAVRGEGPDGPWTGFTLTYPMGTELRDNYPDVFSNVVRTSWMGGEDVLSFNDKHFTASGVGVDTEVPEVFTFEMLQGTLDGLEGSHSVMISNSVAKALFGDDDAINKVITLNASSDVTVTGVFEDFPHNTKFYGVKYFTSWQVFLSRNPWIEKDGLNDWRNHFIHTYVEVLPGVSFEHAGEKIKNVVRVDPADEAKGKRFGQLVPMSRWHLFPFDSGRGATIDKGPLQMVILVGAVGVFVLILACVNFMNLSTARSEKRAKEVGIRKTIGSLKNQLVMQFFSESYLMVAAAFLFSMMIVILSLPWFNKLASKDIAIPWTTSGFWLVCIAFLFITGLLAGSYPALYLSSFRPAKVIKGTLKAGQPATVVRKSLVVLQFVVSVSLIICTIVVHQQIAFAKDRHVGYVREGLITLAMKSRDFHDKFTVLRNEWKNSGVVQEVSASMGRVTEIQSNNEGFSWDGIDPDIKYNFGTLAVTPEHGKTIGWEFIQGRDFSRELAGDSLGVVINESAARLMNFSNPIGETISWKWWRGGKQPLEYKILGVIKDAIMGSPFEPAKPTVFYLQGHNGTVNWINIRIRNGVSTAEALAKIESIFKKVIATAPFDYKFVDQEYNLKFAMEERIGKLATLFASLAIFISCLGVLGLASFTAAQRTKEIGIRKILGASLLNVWSMLTKDFIILVSVSCVVSVPIAYYFMDQWLQKFPYRVAMSWWVFFTTALGALLITLITVSTQAIKTASSNPVNSLRSQG